jgi:hypothetical protein
VVIVANAEAVAEDRQFSRARRQGEENNGEGV